jgi:hypothetical protein
VGESRAGASEETKRRSQGLPVGSLEKRKEAVPQLAQIVGKTDVYAALF